MTNTLRDLDAFIQEKVFGDEVEWRYCDYSSQQRGWHEVQNAYALTWPDCFIEILENNHCALLPCFCTYEFLPDFKVWSVVPEYSANLHDAWKALNKVMTTDLADNINTAFHNYFDTITTWTPKELAFNLCQLIVRTYENE
jgi:hypothetical protein